MSVVAERAIGTELPRVEGPDKLAGRARYAYEYPLARAAYAWLVQAPAPRGRVVHVDASDALTHDGMLAVLWHANAPRLAEIDDAELAILQSDRVAYAGQIVGIVVAETFEAARDAAAVVHVQMDVEEHHSVLRADDPNLYRPEKVNPNFPTDTDAGDVDAALGSAAVVVDETYRTPAYHNNPMEPHSTTAQWDGDRLTVYDSNQGVAPVREALARLFERPTDDVRVVSPHVGGGFGSKGTPRPIVVAAAMAARVVDRPVKLAASRRQMFAFTGYRTPTIQRMRLAADDDGHLTVIAHEVVEQTSTIREFAEQTAVCTRMMYAAPNRRTSHRLVRLDVPTPSWMRAPGECPGMYALESAMDELAVATGIDPIELRRRNDPTVDPESGRPFSSRNLLACFDEGARRFGWEGRDPTPGVRHDGRWLEGTGVAASTYPARSRASAAAAIARADGGFTVEVAAADIGTGARTALTQIAADALGVPVGRVTLELGDSRLPTAPVAGGSMGTSSWGWAVTKACRELRQLLDRLDADAPDGDLRVEVDTGDDIEALDAGYARHAFGAQFVEVRVDVDTGEVRVPRMVGVFAAGRIVNPTTARSQLIGGMTMGLSMALLEESILDPAFGQWMNNDLADYHVATYADVGDIDVSWLDERDDELNPVGTKGIGEIGIVGTAAAVANAVWHATGVRVRDLPLRLDKLLR
jgi:xanthine dehydrogenase YagR molybdenum-binding subunit